MSKNEQIGDRIKVLEGKLRKSGNTLGKEAGLGNKTVDGWLKKPLDFSTNTLEIFLNHYRINRDWWETGEGEIFANSSSKTESSESLVNKAFENDAITWELWQQLKTNNEKFQQQIDRLWGQIDEKDKLINRLSPAERVKSVTSKDS